MSFVHTVVVSTVGTSLFTNGADDVQRRILNAHTNSLEGKVSESLEDWEHIKSRIGEVQRMLEGADSSKASGQSAELNGVVKLEALGKGFSHILLHTDTYLGEQAAKCVADWLRKRDCRDVQTVCLEKMNTQNQESFRAGVDFLLQWCDQSLLGFRASQHEIVFNLVGGFKSLQAYAQTIGMVYADRIVYIFEAKGSGLITIPRLPISFHTEGFEKYPADSVLLAVNKTVRFAEIEGKFAEAFLEVVDVGDVVLASLSAWGRLAWDSVKRKVLDVTSLEFPGLRFEASFVRDMEKLVDADFRVDVWETMASVSSLWLKGGLGSLRGHTGLQYDTYENRDGIGHFRLKRGDRVSCKPDGKVLVLRRVGRHDDVNTNP